MSDEWPDDMPSPEESLGVGGDGRGGEDGSDDDGFRPIVVEVGDETVFHHHDSDCERCGHQADGVLVPASKDPALQLSGGLALCGPCKERSEATLDMGKYQWRQFKP